MAGAFAPTFITSGASAQLGGGDECASAVVIAADTATNFDTTTATASADIPTDALCSGTYLNWVATCKDVWFKFTATGPGTADFSTCATATYDTSLALYKGDCATLVACNGDAGTACAMSSIFASADTAEIPLRMATSALARSQSFSQHQVLVASERLALAMSFTQLLVATTQFAVQTFATSTHSAARLGGIKAV